MNRLKYIMPFDPPLPIKLYVHGSGGDFTDGPGIHVYNVEINKIPVIIVKNQIGRFFNFLFMLSKHLWVHKYPGFFFAHIFYRFPPNQSRAYVEEKKAPKART